MNVRRARVGGGAMVAMLMACGSSNGGSDDTVTGQCAGASGTTLAINDPNHLKDRPEAGWAEVDVFPGGCPSENDLQVGNVTGAPSYVVPASGTLPSVLNLPAGKYGIATLVRDQSCAVMGYGCTNVDLPAKQVATINEQPNAAAGQLVPLGGCMPPLACVMAKCAMAGAGGSTSTGGPPVTMCKP